MYTQVRLKDIPKDAQDYADAQQGTGLIANAVEVRRECKTSLTEAVGAVMFTRIKRTIASGTDEELSELLAARPSYILSALQLLRNR